VNDAVEQEFQNTRSSLASEMLLPLSIPVEG